MTAPHSFPSPSKHRFSDWQTEFEAVLLEGDSQQLPQRVEVAEAACRLRLKNIGNGKDGNVERVAISDARKLMTLVQDVDTLLAAKLNWHKNNRSPDRMSSGPGVLLALSGCRADYNPRRPFEKLLLNVAEQRGLVPSAKEEAATNLNHRHEEIKEPGSLNKDALSAIPNRSKAAVSRHRAKPVSDRPLPSEPTAHQGLTRGDRVEGLGNFGKPLGEFGTVEKANENDAVVKWDDDGRMTIPQPWLQKI